MDIVDDKKAYLNTYKGGPTQMTTSVVGITNQKCAFLLLRPFPPG
jgi:hypothetical protein